MSHRSAGFVARNLGLACPVVTASPKLRPGALCILDSYKCSCCVRVPLQKRRQVRISGPAPANDGNSGRSVVPKSGVVDQRLLKGATPVSRYVAIRVQRACTAPTQVCELPDRYSKIQAWHLPAVFAGNLFLCSIRVLSCLRIECRAGWPFAHFALDSCD